MLLESLFSDVFFRSQWLNVMDHVVAYGIDFCDSLAIAYNYVNRHAITSLANEREVEQFMKRQNICDFDQVLDKAEQIRVKYYLDKTVAIGDAISPGTIKDLYFDQSRL